MKRAILFILLFPCFVFATSLNFSTFVSDFSEKIYDADSMQIAKITGKLYIQKPNLLRMDVKTPEEQVMIVKGDSAMIQIKNTKQITYSIIPKENAWLIPSNILFNTDSLFNVNKTGDTLVITPRDSTIPLDSIKINKNSPIDFMDIFTKDQMLKFRFSKQQIDKKLNPKLFLFPKSSK